jgi:hypothetical protein
VATTAASNTAYLSFVLGTDFGGCKGLQSPISKMLSFEVDLITEIDSPHLRRGGRLTGDLPDLSQKRFTSVKRWEFCGNRRENLVGKWESDRIPPEPAPGPGWADGT